MTSRLLRSVAARGVGHGVRVSFTAARGARVTTSVFQSATRRSVLGERLVFRSSMGPTVRWSGRRQRPRRAPRDGVFFVRVKAVGEGTRDVRRLALRRTRGRFARERTFVKADGCGAVRSFKLERPAFGGVRNRSVDVSFRLATPSQVAVELWRGGRRVKTLTRTPRAGGVLHRLRLDAEGLKRGRYEVRLRVGSTTTSLFLRRV